jgi:hypothetical protein
MRLIETAPGRGVDARGALWVRDTDEKWKRTSYMLAAGSPIREELADLEPEPLPIELRWSAETDTFHDVDGGEWIEYEPHEVEPSDGRDLKGGLLL